jgi:hypothetical protein
MTWTSLCLRRKKFSLKEFLQPWYDFPKNIRHKYSMLGFLRCHWYRCVEWIQLCFLKLQLFSSGPEPESWDRQYDCQPPTGHRWKYVFFFSLKHGFAVYTYRYGFWPSALIFIWVKLNTLLRFLCSKHGSGGTENSDTGFHPSISY